MWLKNAGSFTPCSITFNLELEVHAVMILFTPPSSWLFWHMDHCSCGGLQASVTTNDIGNLRYPTCQIFACQLSCCTMTHRRKSVDSSSSSDSGYDYKEHKDKKDKKNKDKEGKKDKTKEKDKLLGKHHGEGHANHYILHTATTHPTQMSCDYNNPPPYNSGDHHQRDNNGGGQFPIPHLDGKAPAFPSHQSHSAPPTPPSGYRLPLTNVATFPTDLTRTGQPPFFDADGVSPVFIGSALLEKSVHPCKICPNIYPFALVPYGGVELSHHGRYDLLPFVPDMMEWVATSHGRIPSGRRPVEGGYEEDGAKLYHAVAVVNNIKVPGKASEWL